jgi:hypothetical protein
MRSRSTGRGLLARRNAVRPVAITARGTRTGLKERLMTSPNWIVLVVLSLFALFVAVAVAWEVRARRKAGPVRFRLPLASMAKPPRMPAWSKILVVLGMLMVLSAAFISGNPRDLVAPIFFLWVLVTNLQAVHPRRHTRRWLVLASGWLGLVLEAMLLASGLGVFQASLFGMPPWVMLIFSALLLAVGGVTTWEGLSGTLMRERGLEIMGASHPWSRIVVKDWQECDGGFALRLTVLSPRLFGMPYQRDVEMIIPIPAAERPALEVFLAEHAATAG